MHLFPCDEFPVLQELIVRAQNLCAHNEGVRLLTPELRRFISSKEPRRIVDSMLRDLTKNPAHDAGPMQQDNLVLCNEPGGVLIAIGRSVYESNSPVYTSPGDTLIGVIGRALKYRVYDIASNYRNDCFDKGASMVLREEGICDEGDVVHFPRNMPSEYASSGSVVAKVIFRNEEELMWAFDRSTGSALRAYAANVEGTTIRYLVRLLSEYGSGEIVEDALRDVLGHPLHYLRWDAVKAIGAACPAILPEVLQVMAKDKHPHIRSAASRMLESLGAQ